MKSNNQNKRGMCKECGNIDILAPNGLCMSCNVHNVAYNSLSNYEGMYDAENNEYIQYYVPGYKDNEKGTVGLGYGCYKKYTNYNE